MSNKNKALASEVYTSTGFSDLVSSPVFYSVLILTIILGLSSAFGFLQNPNKLKVVVDVISHKILSSQDTQVVNQREYVISQSLQSSDVRKPIFSKVDTDRYSIFSGSFNRSGLNKSADIKPVSFDYDITSNQFWGDLDMTRIESAIEENQRQNRDSLMIGTPIELDTTVKNNDSKYSMRAGLILSL